MTEAVTPPKRSFWWSMRGFFAALGAVVTTAVAVVGLFLPERDTPTAPASVHVVTPPAAPQPTTMGGRIVDVQPTVAEPCCTFSVKVELAGFLDEPCVLESTLVNALDGSETPGDAIDFTPEADTDSARSDVVVTAPQIGTYRVRLVLEDPDGIELDRYESDPFDVG